MPSCFMFPSSQMDPAEDCLQHSYDASSQHQYLTSPPLFLDFQEPQLPDFSYDTSYGRSPIMPIPINPNFRRYTQPPTFNLHISPPLQGLTVAPDRRFVNPIFPSSMEENDSVSISTAFHPGTQPEPDMVLSSSDGVLFYVHSPTLVNIFPNVFQPSNFFNLLDSPESFRHLDVPSDQLNIILHALHGTSPAAHSPDFETLIAAVDRMPAYKITPQHIIYPSTPIYEFLLSYAPLHPIELYALSAHHNLHSLAVTSSSHLLAYNVATITDQMAERIGAVYLKKLLLLHDERLNTLKSILLHPPHQHPSTRDCTFQDQRKLTRAWALVSANLAWDARPDLSTSRMKSALNLLAENLTCDLCHQALRDRIEDVKVQWLSVQVDEYCDEGRRDGTL